MQVKASSDLVLMIIRVRNLKAIPVRSLKAIPRMRKSRFLSKIMKRPEQSIPVQVNITSSGMRNPGAMVMISIPG